MNPTLPIIVFILGFAEKRLLLVRKDSHELWGLPSKRFPSVPDDLQIAMVLASFFERIEIEGIIEVPKNVLAEIKSKLVDDTSLRCSVICLEIKKHQTRSQPNHEFVTWFANKESLTGYNTTEIASTIISLPCIQDRLK